MIITVTQTIKTCLEVPAQDPEQAIYMLQAQQGELLETEYSEPSLSFAQEVGNDGAHS